MGKYRIPFLGGSVAVILAGSALAPTPAFAGLKGNYNLGIGGNLVGTMTIGKHHIFSDVSAGGVTDSGTWTKAKHEKAIMLTITSSSYPPDVGCVLSGTVVRDGINTASSPGSYTHVPTVRPVHLRAPGTPLSRGRLVLMRMRMGLVPHTASLGNGDISDKPVRRNAAHIGPYQLRGTIP